MNERTGLLPTARDIPKNDGSTRLTSLFEHPGHGAATRPEENEEREDSRPNPRSIPQETYVSCQDLSGTCVGSFVFVIYHVVFCLAQAATVPALTGVLAKVAALGTLTAGTSFVLQIQIPALYPATDLFLAPFLAQMAETIQDVLNAKGVHDDGTLFLNTLLTVTGFGLLLSGSLSILAARWKLANWGAYLPYSVLCGFFTTIGILMWTLGFSVDTGMKVGQVLTSKDRNVVKNALLHHIPSVVVGFFMHYAGRQHPYWVLFFIFMTVFIFYTLLWTTGTSITQAQEAQWLFSPKDLQTPPREVYGPPLPFGTVVAVWKGVVEWDAFRAALPTVVALAFLYVIRCSLHAAALFKNKRLLVRRNEHPDDVSSPIATARPRRNHQPRLTLGTILEKGYGYSQLVAALIGGITVAPSVAASLTLFQLHAEKPAPQYGSNLLLLAFYLSDFQLVQYIPKTAFSCLMVLAGIDMCRTWLIGSFFKTKDKMEWAVAPLLVVLSFGVGMLYAILMGIAASAFLFVANFQKAGTVRFVGSGLSLQSTVERTPRELTWLEQNNYLTQILIVSVYVMLPILFFTKCAHGFHAL
jgi:MFS superfamily sulfate permease-like transporter